MILGCNHSMRPGSVGHAQASTQVVRVSDAIEHQQQGRSLQLVQQFIKRASLCHGLDQCGHALVTMAASQLGQAQSIGFDQAHARLFGAGDELAHTGITPTGLEIDFHHGRGRRLQANPHCMEAKKYFVCGHKPRLSCLHSLLGQVMR